MLAERLRGAGWCWWHVPRVLVPLAALVVEGLGAAIGAVLLQEAGVWLGPRFTAPCSRRTARRLFIAAYSLRALFIIPAHYAKKLVNGNGALFQDDYTNDLVGEWLARIARGDGIAIFPGHQHLLDGIYPYLIMASHGVFGFTPLLPKLLSGVLGALSAVLLFEIGRRTFGHRVGTLAALGAAAIPSLVVWSSVSLKEPLVLFVAVLGLWTLQQLIHLPADSPRLGDALVLLLGVMAISLDLRSTLSLILLGLGAIVLLARGRYRPRTWQLGLAACALVVLVGGGLWVARSRISDRPLGGVVEDVVLQIRHRRAQEAAAARSQIRSEPEVLTPTGSALPEAEAASDAAPFSFSGDVLEPLAFSLLAPAPWQARGALELGAAVEMLVVWYPLLLAAVLARPAEPSQRLFLGCLVAYAIANWLVLAASEGNLGNLVRHRLMLVPTLLLLGAAGLDRLWQRRRQAGPPAWYRIQLAPPPAEAVEVRLES